ncbi:hypothetical protein Tco_0513702 [Tanacetum coccineum]
MLIASCKVRSFEEVTYPFDSLRKSSNVLYQSFSFQLTPSSDTSKQFVKRCVVFLDVISFSIQSLKLLHSSPFGFQLFGQYSCGQSTTLERAHSKLYLVIFSTLQSSNIAPSFHTTFQSDYAFIPLKSSFLPFINVLYEHPCTSGATVPPVFANPDPPVLRMILAIAYTIREEYNGIKVMARDNKERKGNRK